MMKIPNCFPCFAAPSIDALALYRYVLHCTNGLGEAIFFSSEETAGRCFLPNSIPLALEVFPSFYPFNMRCSFHSSRNVECLRDMIYGFIEFHIC